MNTLLADRINSFGILTFSLLILKPIFFLTDDLCSLRIIDSFCRLFLVIL
jgi:hypothetical protein